MAKYKILIDPKNEKFLKKQDPKIQARIHKSIKGLENNPQPPQAKKLADYSGWRLRVGNLRILYLINDQERIVEIYRIGYRGDIY